MILVKIIIDNKLLYNDNAKSVNLNTTDNGNIELQQGCSNYVLTISDSIKVKLLNDEVQIFQVKEAIANFTNNVLEIVGEYS
ncbi:MAG: hypothetical protein IJ848_00915 [Alphaproteobacteria bacterium]|nr:hypothetical protein [Alphaproteobacteria bacterium]